MAVRTVGVEEEFLLVDPETGTPRAVAHLALARAPGGELTEELQREQVETATRPCPTLDDLGRELRRARATAGRAAGAAGTAVAALGTSPLPVEPTLSSKDRYRRIAQRFGLTVAEELTCGCHVHVGVASEEEAVGALDRIRPWLAPLLAITANSPFWQGADSGYASYRSQVWSRWPSAGPYAPFGSPAVYHGTIAAMVASDTVLDPAMVYFDARLSAQHPTLEVRVADVCLDVDDAVLLAALARALVETAAREWRAGVAADPTRLEVLRLAGWRAGRSAVDGMLLDPASWRPAPAAEVLGRLVRHVAPALDEAGDLGRVRELLADVLGRGTGARAQRAAGGPRAAVALAVRRTLGG
jgi:carboxylate-amine ligase